MSSTINPMQAQDTPGDEPTGQLLKVLDELSAAMDAAAKYTDPDLTPVALRERREVAGKRAKAAATQKLQQVAATAREAADQAVKATRDSMLNPDKVDATRAGQAWELVIRPRFEATPPKIANWNHIIGGAGPDELAAVLRFGLPAIRRAFSSPTGADTEEGWAQAAAVEDLVQRQYIGSVKDGAAALVVAEKALAQARTTAQVARDILHTWDQTGISWLRMTVKRSIADS